MNRQPGGSQPSLDDMLVDRNEDGFPDDIAGLFLVQERLDLYTWAAIINLAARLGLGASGFTPPIVSATPVSDRTMIHVRRGDAERLTQMAMQLPEDARHGTTADSPPESSAPAVDLSDPWSIHGLLIDRDGDHIADDSAVHIALPDDVPFQVGAALADLAARIGVECAALTLPVAGGEAPDGRTPLVITLDDAHHARLEKQPDGSLTITGSADATAALLRDLSTMTAGFQVSAPGRQAVDWLRRSAAGWNIDGKAARLRHVVSETSNESTTARFTVLGHDMETRGRLYRSATAANPAADIAFAPPRESVVFDHQWTAQWEVDRLLATLDSDVLPRLDPAQPVQLTAMISEPLSVRRRVRGQIVRRMLELGFSQGAVHVLDAFKPGLSWLQEIVLPQLLELDGLTQITLQYRPWDPDDHEGQLDMPIRWLQELFPADEIVARELELPLDRISLEANAEMPPIYRITAFDQAGDTLLTREFSPLWRRIDYLSGMSDAGNVTVTTGGIVTEQSGETYRAHVLTDPEIFWRYVQGELLPHLRRYILRTTDSRPTAADQPFFDELYVDLRISESDEPYGIRQERHSAAEALHEDIYFNVLDFVEELGRTTSGEKLSAPGSVYPFVTVQPGRQPEARIRLTRRPDGIARVFDNGAVTIVRPATESLPETPNVSAIAHSGNRFTFELDRSSEFVEIEPFLRALAAERPPNDAATVIRLVTEDGLIEIGVPEAPQTAGIAYTGQATVPGDEIISNDELFPHLSRLVEHPSVRLIPAAEHSWQGRSIPAVALTSPQSARVWSMRKLAHFKPTMLIVARHHANEVASTTSALQLVELLTRDPEHRRLLDAVNIVLLPLENPDGAALHDELRRTNPTWKHHPARYNATGYEFAEDHGNPDSRYGEGRVRDLVWEACLPDIVVDNHGVPSHEWAQLFAGFGSPPRFIVSYWQVQALLYGILPYLDEPAHRQAAEVLRDHVASRIAATPDLLEWNRTYAERYRTWGHQWVPERFPMTVHGEMIFHGGLIDPDSPRALRSYAVRHPRTTIVNWVTEVCDETVEGPELERTARAHLLANLATIELLRDSATGLRVSATKAPGGVSFRVGRDRPLLVADLERQGRASLPS